MAATVSPWCVLEAPSVHLRHLTTMTKTLLRDARLAHLNGSGTLDRQSAYGWSTGAWM